MSFPISSSSESEDTVIEFDKARLFLKKGPSESDLVTKMYHVEVITKARVRPLKGSKKAENSSACGWEYLVKWAGHDEDCATWEPAKNIETCKRLVQSFWEDIGQDDKDYRIGYEVSASKEWIG